MRSSVRFFAFVLFIAATLCMTPSAQALPRDWYVENYYDCNVELVGYHFFDCQAHHHYVGTQGGAYMEYYQEECSTANPVEYSWWYWNGSSWVPYTGQECP